MDLDWQNDDIDNGDEGNCVYLQIYTIWFYVFNLQMKQDFFKKYYFKFIDYTIFMVSQLRKKNISLTEQIYRFIIEACGYYDKHDKVIQLVQQMKEQNIETSPITHGLFFQAVTRSKDYFASHSIQLQKGEIINAILQFHLQKQKDGVYEKILAETGELNEEEEGESNEGGRIGRVLSKLKLPIGNEEEQQQNKSQFDDIIFTIINSCPNCGRNMYPEEIMSNWKINQKDKRTSCPIRTCLHEFIPNTIVKQIRIQVVKLEKQVKQKTEKDLILSQTKLKNIDKNPFQNGGNNNKIDDIFIKDSEISIPVKGVTQSIEFLSPIILRKELESLMKKNGQNDIMQDQFKETHPIIYWNIIFYFSLIRAPIFHLESNQPIIFYNFNTMLYEKKMEKATQIKDQGILQKMSVYFFNNKPQNEETVNISSISHISQPHETSSPQTPTIKKHIKYFTIQIKSFIKNNIFRDNNYGTKSIKRIFTQLLVRLQKDGEIKKYQLQQYQVSSPLIILKEESCLVSDKSDSGQELQAISRMFADYLFSLIQKKNQSHSLLLSPKKSKS